MNYSPPGRYVWDAWYMPQDGKVHAFFLQARRSDGLSDGDEAHIGHAVRPGQLSPLTGSINRILRPIPHMKRPSPHASCPVDRLMRPAPHKEGPLDRL